MRVELQPFAREEAGGESRPSWPPGVRLGCAWGAGALLLYSLVAPGALMEGRRGPKKREGAGKTGVRTAEG